jgi:hypothetical protein
VPGLRTTVTELATGLGMLGLDADAALARRPAEMVSVSPELWALLERAAGGEFRADFESAWTNGEAFFRAVDGLRRRPPAVIEWKGAQRAPGDEVVPADLRVDHVFLVSCKYLSRILVNASPAHLFERLLKGGHGVRGPDWYGVVAPDEYQALYAAVRTELGGESLPMGVADLTTEERQRLRTELAAGWPETCIAAYGRLSQAVADASARRWRLALTGQGEREAMLWRLLRIGSAPYFVLGAAPSGPLRLRIATPWDWRQEFRLVELDVDAEPAGQPRIGWQAVVRGRHSGEETRVFGHIEIRWSHGRFSGPPEAKAYLDSPHADVPGYFPLR